MPYACLAVAAPLVAQGIPVKILDEFSSTDYRRDLASAAAQADIIGISCFTGYQIESAKRSASFLRRHFPDKPLVWGGYHPSLYPEATLSSPLVDYVIAGQGEWVFLDFAQRWMREQDPGSTPGLWHKREGTPEQNPCSNGFRPLDDFPPFPYELVTLEAFLIDSLTPRSISYHSSLGCPFRCNFCAVMEIYNRRWSGFPAERVLQDVKFLLQQTGAGSVEFYDNNFFVNDERTFAIARAFVDEKLPFLWSAEARPDKIAGYSSEMLDLLVRSGLCWVFIGAESGHDDVLKMMERDHSVAQIVTAAEKLAAHGIKVTFSFNLGYPGEPDDNFQRTEGLAKELRRINRDTELMIYITTAYDATPSFHRAKELAAKSTETLEYAQHLDQRRGEQKAWLSKSYSRKLYNFSIVTFYSTSFLQKKLARRHANNIFLKWLHRLAALRLAKGWYRAILDLRLLNRLFLWSSQKSRHRDVDMWSGRV